MVLQVLNAPAIADLPNPPTGQLLAYDAKLRGFGVRCTATKKSYFCEARVAGRTRRVTIGATTLFNIDEARREAKKILGSMAGGKDVNAEKQKDRARTITLAEALDMYLAGRDLKDRTRDANRAIMKRCFGDWFKKELRTITPAMMVQRFDKLTETRGKANANLAARVMRACWNYARVATANNDGTPTLPENPVGRVTALKKMHKPVRRQVHLSASEYPAFFAGLDKVRSETASNRHASAGRDFADMAELILRTGLRKAEATNIAWADVDMGNRTLTIPAERAKNGKPLTLPMSAQTEAIFQRRWQARGHSLAVFAGEGAEGTLGDPRKSLERLREAIAKPLGMHDLRRSFATVAERCDVSFSKLKRLLNHADNGDVSLGYLVSDDPERLRDEAQKVSDEIDRLAGIKPAQIEAA